MSVVNTQSKLIGIQSAQVGLDVFASNKSTISQPIPGTADSVSPQLPPEGQAAAIGNSTSSSGAGHSASAASPSEKALEAQYQQANAALDAILKKLEPTPKTLDFSVNRKLNQIVIRVIDTRTNKVISEIPSEAVLKMQEHLQSLDAKKIPVGSLLSEQA
jgi:flagellar protein FlaG